MSIPERRQVVEDMEKELLVSQSELEAANRDKEALGVVKQSLKAKLIECKSKLEATAAKYDEKTKALEALETKYKELEKVSLRLYYIYIGKPRYVRRLTA